MFLVSAFKHQVGVFSEKIKGLIIGDQNLMCLKETDSGVKAVEFLYFNRYYFHNTTGFIFVSYRGVNRGVESKGIKRPTMVVNYRYASDLELQ